MDGAGPAQPTVRDAALTRPYPCRVTPEESTGTEIRSARSTDLAAAGELTAAVYVSDGHTPSNSDYVAQLRDAATRAAEADLLVAVHDGRVVGSVTLAMPGSPWAEVAVGTEAEFRMLVVDPAMRGRGIGACLVGACVDRARAAGCTGLALSTQQEMRAAHRLYQRLGFIRAPERDWSPFPGLRLWVYVAGLGPPAWCDQCGEPEQGEHPVCAQRRRFEPPRWCAACRRRLVVQVTPRGWTARCVEHGLRRG
jgi:GNAT superfamily N-acetyltransferase